MGQLIGNKCIQCTILWPHCPFSCVSVKPPLEKEKEENGCSMTTASFRLVVVKIQESNNGQPICKMFRVNSCHKAGNFWITVIFRQVYIKQLYKNNCISICSSSAATSCHENANFLNNNYCLVMCKLTFSESSAVTKLVIFG